MPNIRISAIAKARGITAREVMAKLGELGIMVKSASSTLSPEQEALLVEAMPIIAPCDPLFAARNAVRDWRLTPGFVQFKDCAPTAVTGKSHSSGPESLLSSIHRAVVAHIKVNKKHFPVFDFEPGNTHTSRCKIAERCLLTGRLKEAFYGYYMDGDTPFIWCSSVYVDEYDDTHDDARPLYCSDDPEDYGHEHGSHFVSHDHNPKGEESIHEYADYVSRHLMARLILGDV